MAKDQEEWFRKFQEGTLLIKGWKARRKELLRALPEAERAGMDGLLIDLGDKIGREWAGENETRRIDTLMLQKWGEDLTRARRRGPEALAEAVRKLDAEVDALLGRA